MTRIDTTTQTTLSPAPPAAEPVHLALLVDDSFLHRFGAMFGRMIIGLIDEVINVTVVCPDPDGLSHLTTSPTRAYPFHRSFWPWRTAQRFERLVDSMQHARINLIYSCCGSQAELADQLSRRLDVPYIVAASGLMQNECCWQFKRDRCRGLVALSEPIRDMLHQAYPTMHSDIHLVRPGCFCHPPHQAVREGAILTLVSTGHFAQNEGYDVLLRAMATVAQSTRDVALFLLGEGPLESSLYRWARSAGIGSLVTFLPPMPKWEEILDSADVYIQPAPMTMLHCGPYEAIARACPVIATEVSAFDLVHPGRTGATFRTGDDLALANIILDWVQHPQTVVDLAASTAAFARENLSLHRTLPTLADLCRNILDHEA